MLQDGFFLWFFRLDTRLTAGMHCILTGARCVVVMEQLDMHNYVWNWQIESIYNLQSANDRVKQTRFTVCDKQLPDKVLQQWGHWPLANLLHLSKDDSKSKLWPTITHDCLTRLICTDCTLYKYNIYTLCSSETLLSMHCGDTKIGLTNLGYRSCNSRQ